MAVFYTVCELNSLSLIPEVCFIPKSRSVSKPNLISFGVKTRPAAEHESKQNSRE